MRALVLGGGSLKGAFQAGAIQAILEAGFEPEAIYGISVGSLNAVFLIHEAGRQFAEHAYNRLEKSRSATDRILGQEHYTPCRCGELCGHDS
jgi:predicted acylesterase/phospholipase RssA